MGNIRIKDLAEQIAENYDLSKTKSKELIKELFENIKEAVGDGNKVSIAGFATIKGVQRKPRKARNPRTGDLIFVPGKNAVKFRPSKVFKDYLQVASRNVVIVTKDDGGFKDFLVSNVEKIECKPRVANSPEVAFKYIFEDKLPIYSIIIDSTVPAEEARLICNRVKMDETENILSIVRIMQEGQTEDREMLEILPDEIIYEPFEIEYLTGKISDEVNRIADERGYFSQQVKLRVPTIIGEIEKTYEIMDDFFNKTNLEEEQVDELGNAYREAVGNAASHGNDNNPEKDLFIDFVVDAKNISFSIEDQGEGFDISPFQKRASSAAAIDVARARNALDNPGGMGMMIITKCSDEFYYNSTGTKITVIKHLNLE